MLLPGEPCSSAGAVPLQQCCFSIGQNSVRLPRPVSNTSCFSGLSVETRIFSDQESPLLQGGFANDGGSRSGFPGLPRECPRKATHGQKTFLSGLLHPLPRPQYQGLKLKFIFKHFPKQGGERITVPEWRSEGNLCRRLFSLLLCRSGDQPQVIVQAVSFVPMALSC